MSSTTLVVLVTKTLTEPFGVPAGMMTALAFSRPSSEFKRRDRGLAFSRRPDGEVRQCRDRHHGDVERVGDRVRRNAAGIAALRQREERAVFAGIAGPPKVPLALRVSTMRQGDSVTNCSAEGRD